MNRISMGQPIGDQPGMGILLSILSGEIEPTPDTCLNVHGGITWAHDYPGGLTENPRPGEWWFGFDCAHSGDLSPGTAAVRATLGGPMMHGEYRDGVYVRGECESLARQLVEIQREADS